MRIVWCETCDKEIVLSPMDTCLLCDGHYPQYDEYTKFNDEADGL